MIVIDDGSIDATPRRLASIADPRVRVIRHGHALGVSAARNRGIAEAQADWVAFLDHDDLWSPRKLVTQLTDIGESAFAFSACVIVDQDLNEQAVLAPPASEKDLFSMLRRVDVIPAGSSNVVARTETLRKVGAFDSNLSMLEDWDMWIRLAAAGKAHITRDVVVAYREHPKAWSMLHAEEALLEADYLMDKHGLHGVLDRESFSRWVVRSYRRTGRRLDAAQLYFRLARLNRDPMDLLRGGGVVLGEPAMRLAKRRDRAPPRVDWLDTFRPAR